MLETFAEILMFAVLTLEGLVLAVLLLPLPAFLARPVTQAMKRVNLYVLASLVCLVIFLLLDSWWTVRYWNRELESGKTGKSHDHTLTQVFHAQRNFYCNLFATLLLVVLFRVRQLVSTIATLKIDLKQLKGLPKDKDD